MYQAELEQFRGPLDLLLQLIEGQKLDISQISLAKVTDQYLAYLDQAENIEALDLADFLVVATRLLAIKSKMLLPKLEEEDDEETDLEAQLKIYKDYLDASMLVEKIIAESNFCFSRERLPVNFEPSFQPPKNLIAAKLSELMAEILKRIDYVVNLPQQIMERAVTLKEKVFELRDFLLKERNFSFNQLIAKAEGKNEKVVCFMALLELIKANEADIKQDGVFGDILVEKI